MAICLTIVTYILNTILIVMASVSMGGGVYFIFSYTDTKFKMSMFNEAKNEIHDMIKEINRRPSIVIENSANVSNVDVITGMELRVIYQTIGGFFLVYGIVLAVSSILAFTAVTKNSTKLTKLYQFGLTILALAEMIVLILYLQFPKEISRPIKSFYMERIKYAYEGLRGHDTVSMSWNVFMKKFKCCGVSSYQDFTSSSSFNDTWADPFHTLSPKYSLDVPLTCCNAIEITVRPIRFGGPCHEKDYIHKKGCMSVINDWMYSSKTGIIFSLVICCAVQVILIITDSFNRRKKGEYCH